MRVGLIVDGQGEPAYFCHLIPKIRGISCSVLPKVLYADMQPRATPLQIARAATGAVKVLSTRVDMIVVLIDSEGQACPGQFAQQIRAAFQHIHGNQVVFEAVVKHHAIENWLLSDPDAFMAMRARFQLVPGVANCVLNNKADHNSNPTRLLDKMARKTEYHKKNDPPRIASHQDPGRMAMNSRSFRRFLRVLQHQNFLLQSREPL